ncbi:ubiquitin carboxyl-terminal hydrolase 31 [Aricia agestis]|uniref:ubiquitin carboxyl-terminal hydrolase 31 n=1 Tax=Aricia agestis TaxID=91739 RepID=UPI001C209335|nr:ubiquitin carboxyl-terminal hydrolase 31 [Aricia agestis]
MMSTNNLSSVLKSCSESELINEVVDTNVAPKQNEGSRLKRTFTLPRNPFGSSRPSSSKTKTNEGEKSGSASSITGTTQKDEGGLERKLFRRPSWKLFLNKIAQHMSTVNVSSVKTGPVVLHSDRVPCSGEPPWPPGTTPAATGIKNHGNTCYMNAVLQCLSHTDVIAEYFVLDHYKVDLQKRNKINSKKYGTRGEVTEQLATILKALWSCRYISDMSIAFKAAVERHGSQYRGNSQHDAQEFLFWLLDKVHEDLNTATKKKYKTIKNTVGKSDEVVAAETLANHARRNSSFVQAVFQAQYRSALTCAKCERTSCTFDPFHCVSVQLPTRPATAQPSPLPVNVVYVNQQPRQVRIGVELKPNSTMDDLRTELHKDTGIDREHIILAEINETGWCMARSGWEAAGIDAGALYCLEAPPLIQPATPHAPYLLLLWVNLLDGERFGSPYAMQVPREISYEDLQKLMLKEMCQIVAERVLESAQGSDIFRARIAEAHRPRDPAYLQPELPHPLFSLDVEQALCAHDKYPHLRLELLWDPAHRDSIIRSSGEAYETHVSAVGAAAPLTLRACLAHYTRAEHLAQEDAWRCPQCQRYMPVVKTLGLWSLPDILVIHLKRFRQQAKGRTSTKLTTMVEFPINDFDMTPHLVQRSPPNVESPSHSRSPRRRHSKTITNPQENIYDLYAICYHHGDDLETGHYTAACKNPYDNHWYKFDDSRVTPVDDENINSELVNNYAYMLFYRRKKPQVTHSCSSDENGHWALRMPKYLKAESLTEITEIKEDTIEDCKSTESVEIETPNSVSPKKESIENSPVKQVKLVENASIIQSPTLQRPLIVEVNDVIEDLSDYENETSLPIEPYIHKDVHVNPKMTPIDSRRPRSVDYPARGSKSPSDRSYESSPLVTSINGVEYHPTTEDLMLSMFQESKYIVPRHMSGESHSTGEKSIWKTRIST